MGVPNPPKTCSNFQGLWIGAQVLAGGCMKDGKKMFFDTKKDAVTVPEPAGDSEVTNACCTKFSDAKCSDWAKGGCGLGYEFLSTENAPANSADGKDISTEQYKSTCCKEIPKTCGDYQVQWILNQGAYCAKDGAK